MPSDKKDLPLEANLFWFNEGIWPELICGEAVAKQIFVRKNRVEETRFGPWLALVRLSGSAGRPKDCHPWTERAEVVGGQAEPVELAAEAPWRSAERPPSE